MATGVGGEEAGKAFGVSSASDLGVAPPAPESWMADCPLVQSSRKEVTHPECLEQTVRAAPVITHHRLSGESTSGVDVISQPVLGTVALRSEAFHGI